MKKIVNVPFTVDWCDAFSLLCEILDMKDLVTSEEDLYIYKGSVCIKNKETGNYEPVDDRADLFAALRNVANALVPNLDFRSDPYITNWGTEAPNYVPIVKEEYSEYDHDLDGFKELWR